MGFLKSLFGGKNDGPRVTVQPQTKVVREEEAPVKKVAASVQDLVLLSLAESYKVGEMKYPDYFRTRFGIGFPNETFQKLEKRKNSNMLRCTVSDSRHSEPSHTQFPSYQKSSRFLLQENLRAY